MTDIRTPIEVNRIYCENCLDTMARMPNGFINLTVTSPPYDNLRTYNGYSFDFESVAKELYRVTKPGGVVVWVVSDATIDGSETGTSFKQALYFKEVGFNLHDTMIYMTDKPPMNDKRFQACFEYMFILSKGKLSVFNPIKRAAVNAGMERKGIRYRNANGSLENQFKGGAYNTETVKENIWYFPSGNSKGSLDDVFLHPATFPEKLAADHIYSWSNEGDLIYDPFMGSGTTAKMAHLQKRNWIGSEISAEYVALAQKRIHPYLSQLTIF